MWKNELAESVRTVAELKELGYVNEADTPALEAVTEEFPLLIPRYYLSLINKDDPDDPIRKLCIPSAMEADLSGSFDTSGEADNTKLQGLQHKYKNTALILSTNLCAMYCRHCFRKRLVGVSEQEMLSFMQDAAAYVSEHKEIDNVLISGGDALMNSNRVLDSFLSDLYTIDHLKFVRIGTRTPAVLPSRINKDPELVDMLKRYASIKPLYVVTQFNHPRELTPQARAAIKRLKDAGISVNNQTVLLRGVNDDPAVLAKLLNRLSAAGVLPYYVFQCRPVAAVKEQFQVPLVRAIDIVEDAKSKVSGIAKRFKFAMSHPTGKIEIIGKIHGNIMVFKYHQPKVVEDAGRMFAVQVTPEQAWLSDELT